MLVASGLGLAAVAASAEMPSSPLVAQVLNVVNDYRSQQGLPLLQLDESLETLADDHSRSMAQRHRLTHAGFDERFDRANRSLCVENLAVNYRRAETLLGAWQASPAHLANLLEPRVRWVGISLVDGYLTLFACTPPQAQMVAARYR
jgi:uncharacterized protein YkwD